MIISKVTNWDFINAFKNANRADNFSIESLNALYDYIDAMHYDDSEPHVLNVIELCCSYTEYTDKEYIEAFVTPEIISDLGYEYDTVEELIEGQLDNNIVNELWEHLCHSGILTDNYAIVGEG